MFFSVSCNHLHHYQSNPCRYSSCLHWQIRERKKNDFNWCKMTVGPKDWITQIQNSCLECEQSLRFCISAMPFEEAFTPGSSRVTATVIHVLKLL